jgi:hypothetical protein
MAFVYVLAGGYLILADAEKLLINHTVKIIMGAMLVIYGFYRIYRVFKVTKEQNEN